MKSSQRSHQILTSTYSWSLISIALCWVSSVITTWKTHLCQRLGYNTRCSAALVKNEVEQKDRWNNDRSRPASTILLYDIQINMLLGSMHVCITHRYTLILNHDTPQHHHQQLLHDATWFEEFLHGGATVIRRNALYTPWYTTWTGKSSIWCKPSSDAPWLEVLDCIYHGWYYNRSWPGNVTVTGGPPLYDFLFCI